MGQGDHEAGLAKTIVAHLQNHLRDVKIRDKCNLLYSSVVNDLDGKIVMDVDEDGDIVRRGGAYQQDILLYDEANGGSVQQIPRVAIELKAGVVTTHDGLVYAEKARRLRTIYPYIRFLFLVTAEKGGLPGRLIKNGAGFDAMMVARRNPGRDGIETEDLARLAKVVEAEVAASRLLGDLWFGRRQGTLLWKRIELT